MKVRKCELCNAEAAVFCPSDAAFLCSSCDAKVHEANFLVARHVRRAVCSNCRSFTGDFIAGVVHPSAPTCPSCPPDDGSVSSTNSSACVSSTTSPAKAYSGGRCSDSSSTVAVAKRRRTSVNHAKSEGILFNWCLKLGVQSGLVLETACRGLKVCVDRWRALPFRVSLAASMWLGLRLGLEKSALTWKVLKRLEEISGVPGKIILAAETKLGRAVRGGELEHRRQLELEEGWAEC